MKKHILTLALFLITIKFSFSQGLTLPYYSGYDTPAEKAGWQEFRTGVISSFSWDVSTGGGFTGGCLSHDYNVGGNQNDTVIDWYVSPPLNLTSYAKIALKVQTSGFSTPFPDNCEIWFGTGSPDPTAGNFSLIANLSYMLPQFSWLDTIVDIPFISDSGYIAFKYKTIGAAWSTYSIDNININIDSTVSISKLSPSQKILEIFPNPSDIYTTISTDKKYITTSSEIIICNQAGMEVKHYYNNIGKITLDKDELNAGIYLVSLINDGKVVSSRRMIVD